VTVAQLLLTLEDSEQRRRYLNARATLESLLALGALPVINENDTVATAEIRYGDNDRLAARVAQMISADCLVLLSDIDGLYTADPNRAGDARFVDRVAHITPEIAAMAAGTASDFGSGGMATKIAAARIEVDAGCPMSIAAGAPRHPLKRIGSGARCTPGSCRRPRRRRPQAMDRRHAASGGAVRIDDGALRARRRQEPAAGGRDRHARALRAR
jgi:glutamate 5-kinase